MKKMSLPTEPQPVRGRLSVNTAAKFLAMNSAALRGAVERHAVRAPDGRIEAIIDGVRPRLWRTWRGCVPVDDRSSAHCAAPARKSAEDRA